MKKNKLILLQCLIALVLLSTSVYAAVSVRLNLSISNDKVKPGDELTVKLSIKDIQVSDEGITNIDGYINYDEKVIEKLTVDSIVKDSDGRVTIGNDKLTVEDLTGVTSINTGDNTTGIVFNGEPATDNDCRLLIGLATPLKADSDLLTIKFKVKENSTIGEIKNAIRYDMFVITAGKEKTPAVSEAITLTVEKENQNPDNPDGPDNPTHEHNWSEDTAKGKAATCTEDGYKFYTCSGCEETKKETLKATGHKYGEWEVTKEATVSAEGEKQRKCTVCQNVEKQTVGKLTSKDENKNDTNNTNKNTNTNNNTNTNKADNTVAGSTLPKTGAKFIIIPVIASIILAYISYNRYIKYKNI